MMGDRQYIRKVRHIGKNQPVPCEALRKHPYYNDTGGKARCKWNAKYFINGKNLCRKHAEVEALALLAEETTVETVQITKRKSG